GPLPVPGGQQQATQPGQQPQTRMPPLVQPNQQALAQAQAYEQQANAIEMMKGLGLPTAGDPAALRQAAQQWRQYGLAGATSSAQANAQQQAEVGAAWQKTGPGAEVRMGLASHVNDFLRSVGLPNAFDADKVADWESLEKQSRTAGMQLTN